MNPNHILPDKNNRAAIILAGGDGRRLAQLTRRIDGVHVPKQFYTVLGEDPLLNQTRRRVSLSVPSERVSFVLNRDHEHFFSPLLADVSRHNLIVQPSNRGTAPAILYSLLRLAESAPRASVLLMPSDHHVGDEAALMKYVDMAFAEVEEHSQLTVLVGIAPDEPEPLMGGSSRRRRQSWSARRRFRCGASGKNLLAKSRASSWRQVVCGTVSCWWADCRRCLACSPSRCPNCTSRSS